VRRTADSPRALRSILPVLLAVVCLGVAPSRASAQDPDLDPDRELQLAQPDFTLGALPTGLRLPRHTFGFRITHRFSRPIAAGSASDFFADFFGMDGAARIGFEVRFGMWAGGQIVAHRTNDRSIQILGQQQLVAQGRFPVAIDALVGAEGRNNFSEDFGSVVGAVITRTFGDHVAFYAHPFAVLNTNQDPFASGDEDWTMLVGAGARVRLWDSRVYVVAEAAPQVAGFKAGQDHISVGVERRAGAHTFQITVANALGTTFRQIARGGAVRDDWYIGFSITRKFF
jgi:hypothetical protein